MREHRRNLHGDIWRESVSEEVSEELALHIDMHVHELTGKGMSPEEARRIALAQFRDMREVQAECEEIAGRRDRDMQRATFWSEFGHDVRYAVRQIRSTPWFSLLVIGTLSLGIGASTTIFSAVYAVVLRPPAFENPDRVFILSETWRDAAGDLSAGTFADLHDQATVFEHVAAIDWDNFVVSSGDVPDQMLGAAVTRDYFRVYGIEPVIGRAFRAEDEEPGAPRVVILSHQAYAERFGGDPAIVSRDIRVNGEPARVIGVLPEGFDPLLAGEQLWVPLAIPPERIAERGSRYLDAVGLVQDGVTAESMQDQLDQIAGQLRMRFPMENQDRGIMAEPVQEVLTADYDVRLFLLLGAVLLVLLIACANVANLLLARGAAREKEIAVRAALGAGRARILRQLLTENLVVSAATVLVSIALAMAGSRLIVAFAPADIPRIGETRVDAIVLSFAVVLGLLSSVIFGLAPALRVTRADLQSTLRRGGRDAHGPMRDWLRSSLVVAEVALSVLLLIGAGLLIRTSINAARVDPGFRMDGIVSARITLPDRSYQDPQHVQATFHEIVDRVAASAGVSAAAAASLPPLGRGGNEMFLNVEGKPLTNDDAVVGRMRIISNDYLDVMGIRLTRGRVFDGRDVRTGVLVTIVSEDLAQQLWPGEDPLGKRFACCEGGPEAPVYKTVIGVARSVRSQGPTLDPYPEFYLPLAQAPPDAWDWLQRSMTIVAAGSSTAPLVDAIRESVHGVDSSVPVYGVSTLRDVLRYVTAPARFNTLLLSLLGALGLVLAATGIYGVVSYFVNLRTKEIGVRIALGASTSSVIALMTRQAMIPVAVGLGLGTAAAVAATRLLEASLFEVRATDPLTFGIVLGGLLAVALLAILIPARRASRVEPTEALQA